MPGYSLGRPSGTASKKPPQAMRKTYCLGDGVLEKKEPRNLLSVSEILQHVDHLVRCYWAGSRTQNDS